MLRKLSDECFLYDALDAEDRIIERMLNLREKNRAVHEVCMVSTFLPKLTYFWLFMTRPYQGSAWIRGYHLWNILNVYRMSSRCELLIFMTCSYRWLIVLLNVTTCPSPALKCALNVYNMPLSHLELASNINDMPLQDPMQYVSTSSCCCWCDLKLTSMFDHSALKVTPASAHTALKATPVFECCALNATPKFDQTTLKVTLTWPYWDLSQCKLLKISPLFSLSASLAQWTAWLPSRLWLPIRSWHRGICGFCRLTRNLKWAVLISYSERKSNHGPRDVVPRTCKQSLDLRYQRIIRNQAGVLTWPKVHL